MESGEFGSPPDLNIVNDAWAEILENEMSKQGKDGTDISIPYYFNLAPNYDLEIGPRYIAKRGLGLSSDFRYLTNRTVGEVKGTIFKKDNEYTRETGDSSNKRWEANYRI